MFFEDTSFGEYLDLLNLTGLDQDDSLRLFTTLCEVFKLNVQDELIDHISLFDGNPFYMKNFIHAARQASRNLSEENFWLIYLSEITKGKTFMYWTSILKTYIPHLDLRKPSLMLLYNLYQDRSGNILSNLSEKLSITQQELENIIGLLHASGTFEPGFSELKRADDNILIDFIKGLYLREIENQPWEKIKDIIIGEKPRFVKHERSPSLDITIPATTKAESVAVRTIELVADNFEIPRETIGLLQIALSELFASVIGTGGNGFDYYQMSFKLIENNFSIEILIPQKDVILSNSDKYRIMAYLDDLKVGYVSAELRANSNALAISVSGRTNNVYLPIVVKQ